MEFLLLEFLQDCTGGRHIFFLAAKSYVVDVTGVEERTARLCFLSAAINIGWMIGPALGATIKQLFDYITLFAFNLCLAVAIITFAAFTPDSLARVGEEKRSAILEERENAQIKCGRGGTVPYLP